MWLNAHPLYDDAFWAARLNEYFTVFAAALVLELDAIWWPIRLRASRLANAVIEPLDGRASVARAAAARSKRYVPRDT